MNTIEKMQSDPRSYWQERYANQETKWDMGHVSPPLKAYFDGLPDKNIRILIPGCGNGYEADYLMQQGFTNVTMLDIAPEPVARLKTQLSEFVGKSLHVEEADFFAHEQTYDLIVEQTFFCALPPVFREKYAQQMQKLLHNENSRLVGVLFNATLNSKHPPFGGFADDYQQLLGKYLHIYKMENCHNSHPSRQNRELFVLMGKK
jgi:hypothetical protein